MMDAAMMSWAKRDMFSIVILISGLIATFGYEFIPFKAYAIVAATIGLLIATFLIKFKESNNG